MRKLYIIFILVLIYAEAYTQDSTAFKKRVLEDTELEILSSFYSQKGEHAAVTGGLGTESLIDATPTIVLSIPLNADDVLTVDAGISAYSSASSSNLDPFDNQRKILSAENPSPWVASSGASRQDVWTNGNIHYSHSSDSRNTIYDFTISGSNEFDYSSFGAGAGIAKLLNHKNTEIGLKTKMYFDFWRPETPIELRKPNIVDQFNVYNSDGNLANNQWEPAAALVFNTTNRNSFNASLSFSQILSKRAQISLFGDFVLQKGLLSNPMQRVYFADIENYFAGSPNFIQNYTQSENTGAFMLADEVERLPDTRMKYPLGGRLNIYFFDFLIMRTYYRYYFDSWNLKANTVSVELPVKISQKFTIIPAYRYYNQSQIDYFAPFDQHLSTETYYTSDYDLSTFNSNQFGLNLSYTDIFMSFNIGPLSLKNAYLKYSYYRRSNNLQSNIVSFGLKFILEKDKLNKYKKYIDFIKNINK